MKLNDNMYDILKYMAQIVLPAVATLYFAISGIWGLPFGEEIVGTITAIDCFLGALLGLSSTKYEGDGRVVVNEKEILEEKRYNLEFNDHLSQLINKDKIILNVKRK